MKSRVALFATLIALIALALLFTYNYTELAEEENEQLRVHLKDYCTVLSESIADKSDGERSKLVSSISVNEMF